jgi:spore germination cell wall hydrolase CwlJ-like protein
MLERSIVIFFLSWFILATALQTITGRRVIPEQSTPQEELVIAQPINAKHLKCLATGIYYEAKGESTIGQIAVARVIMNRVLHGFAGDPCSVVYQSVTRTTPDGDARRACQFSWVCDGKGTPSENNPSYRRALDIAHQVLAEDKWNDILPNNTLFFHNLTAAPGWVYKKVTTIGNHVFYSKGHEKKITTDEQPDK